MNEQKPATATAVRRPRTLELAAVMAGEQFVLRYGCHRLILCWHICPYLKELDPRAASREAAPKLEPTRAQVRRSRMKFHWFHLMPYPYLPDDFKEKHRSVWVDLPAADVYDPVKGHQVYNDYLDELEFADRAGF